MSVELYQLDPIYYSHLLSSPQITYLFSLFHEHEHSIRFVGGVVRDLLLGLEQHDIDLATSATTDEMFNLIRADSNIEYIYTRAEHFGTLTLVVGTTEKKTFQITILKKSIVRQGQNVSVEFTDDWSIDAQQRDLSINSLSMDENGIIFDYTNAIDDLKQRRIRFNGSTLNRLEENPIRILRYFRFFSELSNNPELHDPIVLDAIRQSRHLLKLASNEKIWMELNRILRSRWAGYVMRTIFECQLASTLKLPESTVGFLELENRWLRSKDEQPEPITLLITLFDNLNEFDQFCQYMKCSSKEKRLGYFLLNHRDSIDFNCEDNPLRTFQDQIVQTDPNQQNYLYFCVLELLKYQGYNHLFQQMKQWSIPHFPINISDFRQTGLLASHRQHLRWLRKLQKQWLLSNYKMTKDELLEYGFESGLFYT